MTAVLRRVIGGLVVPLALVALWYLLSARSTSPFFPPLRVVLASIIDSWVLGELRDDFLYSAANFLAGFALAVLLGITVGGALGLSRRIRRDSFFVVEFLRATPLAALVPILFVLAGSGRQMEIALIALASTWPVLVSMAAGVRSVDQSMLDMARVYGLSAAQRLMFVRWPGARPQLFAGLRVAVGVGIIATVVSNMFASNQGVGYAVLQAYYGFDAVGTWAGLIIIGLAGAVANLLFVGVEHVSLGWYRGWRAAAVAGS